MEKSLKSEKKVEPKNNINRLKRRGARAKKKPKTTGVRKIDRSRDLGRKFRAVFWAVRPQKNDWHWNQKAPSRARLK